MLKKRKRQRPEIQVDINWDSSQWSTDIEALIIQACEAVFDHVKISMPSCEVSIMLTDDKTIQGLNKIYRQKDSPTNVLSFPINLIDHSLPAYPLGDVILAFETIVCEAKDQQKDFINHVMHLTIHGILHLLGYDHIQETDAMEMEALEIAILNDLNIPNPYEIGH